jgi:hypothetical protein
VSPAHVVPSIDDARSFAEELALVQPPPGYMPPLTESVPQIWKARKTAVRDELTKAERTAKATQDKPDRWDEAVLFERSIDIETYDRHAQKLREEFTLAPSDRQTGHLENSTSTASWLSQNAYCRAPRTSGSRRYSNSDNGSKNCSFRTESPSTVPRLLEPPQLHRPSATCGESRLEM